MLHIINPQRCDPSTCKSPVSWSSLSWVGWAGEVQGTKKARASVQAALVAPGVFHSERRRSGRRALARCRRSQPECPPASGSTLLPSARHRAPQPLGGRRRAAGARSHAQRASPGPMAALDGTPEGLAAAAATREALARKRSVAAADAEPSGKKKTVNRPPPTCTHEVARPEGFKDGSIKLSAAAHGEALGGRDPLRCAALRCAAAANMQPAAASAGRPSFPAAHCPHGPLPPPQAPWTSPSSRARWRSSTPSRSTPSSRPRSPAWCVHTCSI